MAKLEDLPRLIQSQDWATAERVLRKAAQGKSASAEVFYNLAKVLEQVGKPEQRAAWLKRAVARRPDYALAWFELGRIALEDGESDAALKAYQKAWEGDPSDSDARRMVARLSLRLGRWEAAERALQDDEDTEAMMLRYRIAAEMGDATPALRDELLQDAATRPDALRTLTRVAKGSVSLRLPQLRT